MSAVYAYHRAARDVERAELDRMLDHMRVRGPDGVGNWFDSRGRVGIGHRRLSIIDLTPRASQPMVSDDGLTVLSFNGEIYNYRTLRRQLEMKGYVFRSDSDTEVLLNMYRDGGTDMLAELRGMFAFALWDVTCGALLLARDAYGIKPLYYADDGWCVRAASQVKTLLATRRVSRAPEPAGVAGFYLFGSVPEPFTTYQEVRSVPAGSYLWVDERGPQAPTAWLTPAQMFAEAARDTCHDDQATRAETIRTALVDSVRQHMESDVPVGAFLSAGIDSGAVAGVMSELGAAGAGRIRTITLGFDEFRGGADDETVLAQAVAERYGLEHTSQIITQDEFARDIGSILQAMDQPSIDGINTWLVSRVAADLGLKVVLSGIGADELFGGYPSFARVPRWRRSLAIPGAVPGLGRAARRVSSSLASVLGISPKAAGLLEYGGSYGGAYLLQRGLFMSWELPELMGEEMAREGLRRLRPLAHIAGALEPMPSTAYARVAALESSLYLRNQLLRDADWAGMAHGLEIRTPFVDVPLTRSVAPLMTGGFEKTAKAALAHAPRVALPDAVVRRSKSGFRVPVDDWISGLRSGLEAWRMLPMLAGDHCHWSRRLAYCVQQAWSTR